MLAFMFVVHYAMMLSRARAKILWRHAAEERARARTAYDELQPRMFSRRSELRPRCCCRRDVRASNVDVSTMAMFAHSALPAVTTPAQSAHVCLPAAACPPGQNVRTAPVQATIMERLLLPSQIERRPQCRQDIRCHARRRFQRPAPALPFQWRVLCRAKESAACVMLPHRCAPVLRAAERRFVMREGEALSDGLLD